MPEQGRGGNCTTTIDLGLLFLGGASGNPSSKVDDQVIFDNANKRKTFPLPCGVMKPVETTPHLQKCLKLIQLISLLKERENMYIQARGWARCYLYAYLIFLLSSIYQISDPPPAPAPTSTNKNTPASLVATDSHTHTRRSNQQEDLPHYSQSTIITGPHSPENKAIYSPNPQSPIPNPMTLATRTNNRKRR